MQTIESHLDVAARLRRAVRDIADFPRPGIVFKDITPILGDRGLFAATTEALAAPFADDSVTHVAAIESRGFILGAPVARVLNTGFIPVRKRGKLPYRTEGIDYALEYGTDRVEAHVDACTGGARVLVVDDVLATGGTAAATCKLLEALGATVVGCSFLLTIVPLGGAGALGGRRIHTLLTY